MGNVHYPICTIFNNNNSKNVWLGSDEFELIYKNDMTTIYKRREGGSSLGSFSDGVESVIFHIDLVIIIAGGLLRNTLTMADW